jgi:hypothetical protein
LARQVSVGCKCSKSWPCDGARGACGLWVCWKELKAYIGTTCSLCLCASAGVEPAPAREDQGMGSGFQEAHEWAVHPPTSDVRLLWGLHMGT